MPQGVPLFAGQREKMLAVLRSDYEAGASIRTLAGAYGASYTGMHRLLVESGATLRGVGGYHRPGPVKPREPPARQVPPTVAIQRGRKAAELRAEGLKWKDIAEQVGARDARDAGKLATRHGQTPFPTRLYGGPHPVTWTPPHHRLTKEAPR